MKLAKLSLLALAVGALVSGTAAAQSYSFRQGVAGYLGTQDTTIREADPAAVLGADDFLSVDGSDDGLPNQVLIRFDNLFGTGPGQIDPALTITSAILRLEVTSAGSGFSLHDMLTNWSQGTATWNSFGNGVQANGVEAATASILTLGANNGAANIGAGPLALDVTASLNAARTGGVPGYGWVMLPFLPDGTNGIDFPSSEAALLAERPLLEVTAVPEPGEWAMMLAGLVALGAVVRNRRRA
jgi:hypothetical protein